MKNIDYLAFADSKCTVTVWCQDKFELQHVIETDQELDLGNFVFVNNYKSLSMISKNGELYIWNFIYK